MKVIIVGINPSHRRKALKNSTFDRLGNWVDRLGIEYYSFINCFDFPKHQATKSDVDFATLELTKGYDKVIVLGGFAASCLDDIGVGYFKMPHPSPRNRLLNDKDYEERMIDECKQYLLA